MTSDAASDSVSDLDRAPLPWATDLGIVDLMIGFPSHDEKAVYSFLTPQLKDAESKDMRFPAEYMFTDVPDRFAVSGDPVALTLAEMDRFGIAIGMVALGSAESDSRRALREHPSRFRASLEVDPNDISGAVRSIRAAHDSFGIVAVTSFPAGCNPQVAISDRRYYPIYQTCVDLGIPMVINAGIAGPRVPSSCQDVMHLDQVCYDFPELTIVMRHGGEPWQELAVKLMLKWPGLHYMTSAFAPRHYPAEIVRYANTRGADKILYAGYFPMGLTLERIFSDMPRVAFRDHVWPLFLRENAIRIFNL